MSRKIVYEFGFGKFRKDGFARKSNRRGSFEDVWLRKDCMKREMNVNLMWTFIAGRQMPKSIISK